MAAGERRRQRRRQSLKPGWNAAAWGCAHPCHMSPCSIVTVPRNLSRTIRTTNTPIMRSAACLAQRGAAQRRAPAARHPAHLARLWCAWPSPALDRCHLAPLRLCWCRRSPRQCAATCSGAWGCETGTHRRNGRSGAGGRAPALWAAAGAAAIGHVCCLDRVTVAHLSRSSAGLASRCAPGRWVGAAGQPRSACCEAHRIVGYLLHTIRWCIIV